MGWLGVGGETVDNLAGPSFGGERKGKGSSSENFVRGFGFCFLFYSSPDSLTLRE